MAEAEIDNFPTDASERLARRHFQTMLCCCHTFHGSFHARYLIIHFMERQRFVIRLRDLISSPLGEFTNLSCWFFGLSCQNQNKILSFVRKSLATFGRTGHPTFHPNHVKDSHVFRYWSNFIMDALPDPGTN